MDEGAPTLSACDFSVNNSMFNTCKPFAVCSMYVLPQKMH